MSGPTPGDWHRILPNLLEAIKLKHETMEGERAAKVSWIPFNLSPVRFVPFSERPIVTVGDKKNEVYTLCGGVLKLADAPRLRICSHCNRSYLCPNCRLPCNVLISNELISIFLLFIIVRFLAGVFFQINFFHAFVIYILRSSISINLSDYYSCSDHYFLDYSKLSEPGIKVYDTPHVKRISIILVIAIDCINFSISFIFII